MFNQGFLERLYNSFDRVLFGLDLLISLVISLLSIILSSAYKSDFPTLKFVEAALPLATTLIIVTVTSVSILVSLSNSSAITQLKKDQLYGKFLFTFEFTAMLALLTSTVGIFALSLDIGRVLEYVFLFLMIYTILATATAISRLITYGDKIALLSLAASLPANLDERTTEIGESDEEGEDG